MGKREETRRKNLRDRRAQQIKAMVDAGDSAGVREMGIDEDAIARDMQELVESSALTAKQLGARATQRDLLRHAVYQQHMRQFHSSVEAAERKALELRIEQLEGRQ